MRRFVLIASLCAIFCSANGMRMSEKIDVEQKRASCAKRSKFTQDEDRRLSDLVKEFGSSHWKIVADQMPGKSARQVRERWNNYLAPFIDHSSFSKEEDMLLLQKVQELGKKWAALLSYFPGRTSVMIKNRYATLLRRKTELKDEKCKCNFTSEQSVEIGSGNDKKNGSKDTEAFDEIEALKLKYFDSSSDFDMCLKWPGLD